MVHYPDTVVITSTTHSMTSLSLSLFISVVGDGNQSAGLLTLVYYYWLQRPDQYVCLQPGTLTFYQWIFDRELLNFVLTLVLA